jgi:lysophospholipase L1-like esterase
MNHSGHKPFQPFLILFLCASLLLLLSSSDRYLRSVNKDLKRFQLFSDIVKTKRYSPLAHSKSHLDFIQKDTSKFQVVKHDMDSLTIADFAGQQHIGMTHFFEALKNIKTKKKVRIAWFGDSMVEGDLITCDLRYMLQKRFGGSGVGIVPITSITAGFRQTVQHTFSDNWTSTSILAPTSGIDAPGITGFTFKPQPTKLDTTNIDNPSLSWVKYKGSRQRGLDQFIKAKLFYGTAEGEHQLHVNINNTQKMNVMLDGKKAVNTFELHPSIPFKEVKFTFINQQKLPVYAVSLESDTGVIVDNLSFRGNSGLPLTRIPEQILRGFDEVNQYDLIILQYGMNAVSPDVTDYSWYTRGLDRMVKHIQKSFPNAAILFVGVPDKGYKQDGQYITNPGVPYVMEAEKKVAENNGIAFWNLFEAMGGYNSMVKWAEADTSLANKDYTHFNFRGASKVARLLFHEIDKEYKEYLKSNASLKATLPSQKNADKPAS